MRRVVVTGMSAITALGHNWQDFEHNLRKKQNVVQVDETLKGIDGLNTHLSAPILDFTKPAHYSRKQVRSMGRVALMATRATEVALEDAKLLSGDYFKSGRMGGVAYGSSTGGSTDPYYGFWRLVKVR